MRRSAFLGSAFGVGSAVRTMADRQYRAKMLEFKPLLNCVMRQSPLFGGVEALLVADWPSVRGLQLGVADADGLNERTAGSERQPEAVFERDDQRARAWV